MPPWGSGCVAVTLQRKSAWGQKDVQYNSRCAFTAYYYRFINWGKNTIIVETMFRVIFWASRRLSRIKRKNQNIRLKEVKHSCGEKLDYVCLQLKKKYENNSKMCRKDQNRTFELINLFAICHLPFRLEQRCIMLRRKKTQNENPYAEVPREKVFVGKS